MWLDTKESYGLVSVSLHWLTALVAPGLFALGLWMVDLTYYDPWYNRAPQIHKSTGVLLFLVLLFRVAWQSMSAKPQPEPNLARFERIASKVVHIALYLLLFAVMSAGYLISTADGHPIDVFGLFQVPATISGIPNQADVAGQVHLLLAITLISLAGLHALAALKHHFIDHDRTLLRMLGR